MISAGNDIVVLQAVDAQRTQSPAFYSKFISPKELALYKPDELSLVNFVWMLWSAKESAYKYLKRNNPELIFAPAKMTVQQLRIFTPLKTDTNAHNQYKGELQTNDIALPFLSVTTDQFIATTIDQGDVRWAVKQIETSDYESQSKAVRSFLLDDLKMSGVTIEKHPAGYPVLLKDGKDLGIAVSFAHHDRYISYCYQISK
ncbi:4'-phosphopantetheinyl transferase superfamily protein [Mucilaginibacter panaciglaebae]|uniref:4'-phosphopantetheinyl transferase domain-containing protein n=1 Tax=Mucilaginibacter panaciglaebae TaxID=502331 RepID=A0ABP7W8K6_9SPHI